MARAKESVKALAYLRTSSAANVGAEKDSEARQRAAIEGFAKRAGYEVVDWFSDPAVSGADAIEARPGFAAMLARIAGNGVRTILVETANRFARDLIVQETGYRLLRHQGITLVAADSPEAFLDDTPTAVLIRQVLGAVAQFEKAMLVSKLKGARDRKRAKGVKVEGRKSYAETRPEVVALAQRLHRKRPKGGQRSLREISEDLAKAGHLTSRGKPYAATAIAKMLKLVVRAREEALA
jgi:DNA invertase Pin-like site-specific DNA recombinase